MYCNIVLSGTSCKLCASDTCLYNVSRWTPKGQMIVHIHEHKESINRLVVTSFLSQSSLASHTPPFLLTLLPPFSQPPSLLTTSLPSHNLLPSHNPPSLLTLLHPFHRSLSLHPLLPLLSSCLPLLFLVLFCIFKRPLPEQHSVCHDCNLSLFRLISSLFSDQNPSAPGQYYLCYLLRRWNNQSLGRS